MRPNGNPIKTFLPALWMAFAVAGCSRESTTHTPVPAAAQADARTSDANAARDPNRSAVTLSSAEVDGSADYVGSQRCVACHEKRHESYLKSHHSRSLTKVDVDAEQVGVTLEHPLSHRAYEIVRRDGKLWHRETILEAEQQERNDGEDPLVISEFPIDYVMGSGKFAKGYLVSSGPFLLQSPVTWYVGKESYEMSPGYDSPGNSGFGRAVTDECLFCHSGMVTREKGNRYFFTIDELAIGCERCHGPGKAHVEHFESLAAGGKVDPSKPFHDSIIHPGKLDRLQSESLCGQCHCQGEAAVSRAGTRDWEFRPGDDFASFKINYDAVNSDKWNTRFVGHFPQLHASACYQGSTTMTCVTCHNPHHHPEGEARHELHRQQCLECHQDEACGVPLDARISRAENRCVECHMPKTRSEVPHTSTTNHRIAVYPDAMKLSAKKAGTTETSAESLAGNDREPAEGERLEQPQVLALQDNPVGMTPGEAARMRAVGTYWLYRKHLDDPNMQELAHMAGQALQQVVQAGQGDADVFADLAMLTYMQLPSVPPGPDYEATVASMWDWAMSFAQESLRLESKPSECRETALEIAGRYFYRADQHQQSVAVFGELTQMRRRKEDWAMMGISLAQLGDLKRSESALRESIRINGGDADLYETLAIVLAGSRPKEAAELNATARRIRQAKGQSTQIP